METMYNKNKYYLVLMQFATSLILRINDSGLRTLSCTPVQIANCKDDSDNAFPPDDDAERLMLIS
jgi:hypothetical protein